MIVINNLMKHLQDYELEGLKLRNKKTKEFKVFSNKEELFYEVYNIYIIYKTKMRRVNIARKLEISRKNLSYSAK